MGRRVQVATVGRSTRPILNGYLAFGADVVILLPSVETEGEAKQIARQIDDLAGRPVCQVRPVDKFDLTSIVLQVRRVRQDLPDAELLVNITGGTNVMASSALVACYIVGARAFYMREEPPTSSASLRDTVIDLPIPRVAIDDLSAEQRRVLRSIRNKGGELRPANSRIAQELGVSFQDASYHLKRLTRFGLIEVTTDGREKVARLTPEGLLYAELVARDHEEKAPSCRRKPRDRTRIER